MRKTREPTRNSKGVSVSRKPLTPWVCMGQDGTKEPLANGGKCRCGKEGTKAVWSQRNMGTTSTTEAAINPSLQLSVPPSLNSETGDKGGWMTGSSEVS